MYTYIYAGLNKMLMCSIILCLVRPVSPAQQTRDVHPMLI